MKRLDVKYNNDSGARALAMIGAVRRKLTERKGEWGNLSRATGIPADWIHYFASGKVKDPAFTRIVYIAEFVGVKIGQLK